MGAGDAPHPIYPNFRDPAAAAHLARQYPHLQAHLAAAAAAIIPGLPNVHLPYGPGPGLARQPANPYAAQLEARLAKAREAAEARAEVCAGGVLWVRMAC